MFGSAVIDTALGMVFVYFIVSNICSSAFTYYSRWYQVRGRLLQEAILYLLGDEMRKKVMAHALIQGGNLTATGRAVGTNTDDAATPSRIHNNEYPDYIAPKVFAEALIDVILNMAEIRLIDEIKALLFKEVNVDRGRERIEQDLRTLADKTEAEALALVDSWIARINQSVPVIDEQERSEIHGKVKALFFYKEDIFAFLEKGITDLLPDLAQDFLHQNIKLINRQLRLEGKVRTGQEKLLALQKQIEVWFDAASSSLTPIFKRRSRNFIGVVAIFVTLIFNINSIAIAEALWKNPTVRDAIVETADTRLRREVPLNTESNDVIEDSAPQDLFRDDLEALNIPVGWTQEEIENLPLPLPEFLINFLAYAESGDGRSLYSSTNQLLGWLITVVAAMLGAPFWFDVLNKIMNIRNRPKDV